MVIVLFRICAAWTLFWWADLVATVLLYSPLLLLALFLGSKTGTVIVDRLD